MDNLIILSRKKNKTEEETNKLYEEINSLVIKSKLNDNNIALLYDTLYPHMLYVISYLYKKFRKEVYTLDFNDLISQSYFIFREIVDEFDASKSKFLYYFKFIFHHKLQHYITDEHKILKRDVAYITADSQTRDRRLKYKDPYFHIMIYKYGESYLDTVIMDLIKETKSRLHKDVLYSMIYGDINVPDIARKYKITYHAVYSTKRTFQYKIAQAINEKSHLFNYYVNCKKAESKKKGNMAYKFQLIKKIS